MSFNQVEKLAQIKANSFAVPGGQVAHWVTRYGQVIDIGEQRHIHYLALHNEEFAMTNEHIYATHKQFNEKLGTEGSARDELIIEALKQGWVTTRFIGGHRSHWAIRVWDIEDYQIMHSLVCWAQEVVAKEGPHSDKYAPIYIYDYKRNKKSKHKLEMLNEGWFKV